MGDDGGATRLVDQGDRLLRGGPTARYESLGAWHQVLLEERAEVAGCTRCLGDMGAADRERVAGLLDRVLQLHFEAPVAQPLDDLLRPVDPFFLRPLASWSNRPQIDPVAADMEIFGVLVHARHLN